MKNRTILITGGAGFIGSHLAKVLCSMGHNVRVMDNFSSQVHGERVQLRDQKNDPTLNSIVEIVEGDVRSPQDLLKALRGVDVVYHFAASVGVGQSMYEVSSYIDNNNMGTAHLLQLLIEKPVERLVVASSMSIYGEGLYQSSNGKVHGEIRRNFDRLKFHDWEPQDESGNVLKPIPTPETKHPDLASIYALTKFDQEQMCLMMGRAYQIPTVALRFFNVYGRGQSLSNPYTGVMAIFASRLLNNAKPIIFEDGNQMRDFVHVSDVVQACCLAMQENNAIGHAFNIGSGHQYTVKEIAMRMAHALNKEPIQPEITGQYRIGDIRHCFADISKAKRVLGYQPKMTLSDGIVDLVEWLNSQKAIDRTQKMREELVAKGLTI